MPDVPEWIKGESRSEWNIYAVGSKRLVRTSHHRKVERSLVSHELF